MEKLKNEAYSFFIKKEWLTGILIPLVFGALVFFTIKLFRGKNCWFWGVAAWYFLFGAFLSFRKVKDISLKFEIGNIIFGLLAIIISIFGWIFGWGIVGVPTLVVGLVILLCAIFSA